MKKCRIRKGSIADVIVKNRAGIAFVAFGILLLMAMGYLQTLDCIDMGMVVD